EGITPDVRGNVKAIPPLAGCVNEQILARTKPKNRDRRRGLALGEDNRVMPAGKRHFRERQWRRDGTGGEAEVQTFGQPQVLMLGQAQDRDLLVEIGPLGGGAALTGRAILLNHDRSLFFSP